MKRLFLSAMILLALPLGMSCQKSWLPADGDISVALDTCSESRAGVYICLDKVITDSRCPEGAVCVWSGEAVVRVRFHEAKSEHTFNMSLYGTPVYGYPTDTAIGGYKIVFKDLKPHPAIPSSPEPRQIVGVFSITK